MKKVYQEDRHDDEQKGQCLRASIASILEINISDIPAFEMMSRDTWGKAMRDWFSSQGYNVYRHKDMDPCLKQPYLAIGQPVVGLKEMRHCVVYQDGKLLHDPHPRGNGIIDANLFFTIEKLRLN